MVWWPNFFLCKKISINTPIVCVVRILLISVNFNVNYHMIQMHYLFQDFILEHYSEEGSLYEDAIAQFMDMRQVSLFLTRVLFKYVYC